MITQKIKEMEKRIEELKEKGYGKMIIEKNSLQEKAILETKLQATKETAKIFLDIFIEKLNKIREGCGDIENLLLELQKQREEIE